MFNVGVCVVVLINAVLSSHDLCAIYKENFCKDQSYDESHECHVETSTFHKSKCSAIPFLNHEKSLRTNLGMINLRSNLTENFHLNVSFSNVNFKKAYLKLSVYRNPEADYLCRMYTVGHKIQLPIDGMFDKCFWTERKLKTQHYQLELKAETKNEVAYTKILFSVPKLKDNTFGYVPIFYYIDLSDNYMLSMKIQTAPHNNESTTYKVEVYREKDNKSSLIDVRLIPELKTLDQVTFDYITFNEEGFYFFAISYITDKCPEDTCYKFFTPKIFISRKGTPLVIGIVGASCIIPLILFFFYVWNRKTRDIDVSCVEIKSKIVIIYKTATPNHNQVVHSFANLLTEITNNEVILDDISSSKSKKHQEKWCEDNLYLANHIVYISPPSYMSANCHFDFTTHCFLKQEASKRVPEKDIVTVFFPYSNKEIHSLLTNCLKFYLLDDLNKLLGLFEADEHDVDLEAGYEHTKPYETLVKWMNLTKIETESKRYQRFLVMPTIVITDDGGENAATESDGLL